MPTALRGHGLYPHAWPRKAVAMAPPRKLTGDSALAQPRRHLADGRELHHAQTTYFLMGAHFVKGFFWRSAVQAQDGDCFTAGQLTAHGHLGDVDVVLAENIADEADETRHITVSEHQHGA